MPTPLPDRLRLSSRLTRWYKRLFPVLCIGAPVAWLVAFLWAVRGGAMQGDRGVEAMGMGVAGFALGAGMLLLQKFSLDPVDEVWLEGEELLVRNKGKEVRVPLREVVKMTPSKWLNPKRLTIALAQPTALGEKIVFILPGKKRQPDLEAFVQRLNHAHGA